MGDRPAAASVVPHPAQPPRHPAAELLRSIDGGIRHLPPSYFAMVMATGIIAVAAHAQGLGRVAAALARLNLAAYVVLWGLTLLRLARHPGAVLADLTDHHRSPGFFTVVAATGTLGSQVLVLWGDVPAATLLCLVATLLWTLLTFAVFTALTIKASKPSLAQGITGAWLLAVVATQSVAVLSGSLAPLLGEPLRAPLEFFALCMWLWGGMLYVWMISLIFYRYTFFPFSPSDLTPPYWINMGAMAITTLAGATLLASDGASPFLQALEPFLTGATILAWATGTWWIPMLLILGVWRHVVRRFPLRYDPGYWGAVFPLGMYTVATLRLAEAVGLDFLRGIPPVGLVVALAAWLATFTGLSRSLLRGALRHPADLSPPRP